MNLSHHIRVRFVLPESSAVMLGGGAFRTASREFHLTCLGGGKKNNKKNVSRSNVGPHGHVERTGIQHKTAADRGPCDNAVYV